MRACFKGSSEGFCGLTCILRGFASVQTVLLVLFTAFSCFLGLIRSGITYHHTSRLVFLLVIFSGLGFGSWFSVWDFCLLDQV